MAAKKQFSTCTIIRVFKVREGTINTTTGKSKFGPWKLDTGPCNVPLFIGHERKTGVCRSCGTGKDSKDNSFAYEAERERAVKAWKGA